MWVRFTADYDFSPPESGGRSTVSYKDGQTRNVRRICGEAAVKAGKAVPTETPKRDGK